MVGETTAAANMVAAIFFKAFEPDIWQFLLRIDSCLQCRSCQSLLIKDLYSGFKPEVVIVSKNLTMEPIKFNTRSTSTTPTDSERHVNHIQPRLYLNKLYITTNFHHELFTSFSSSLIPPPQKQKKNSFALYISFIKTASLTGNANFLKSKTSYRNYITRIKSQAPVICCIIHPGTRDKRGKAHTAQ